MSVDPSKYIPFLEFCNQIPISYSRARKWLKNGVISDKDYIIVSHKCYIKIDSIPKIRERSGYQEVDLTGYISKPEAIKIFQKIRPDTDHSTVSYWIKTKRLKKVVKWGKRTYLEKKEVVAFSKEITYIGDPRYITGVEIVKEYPFSDKGLKSLCDPFFPGAKVLTGGGSRILIPRDEWENFISTHDIVKCGKSWIRPKHTLTVFELTKRLKRTRKVVKKLLENNEFPNMIVYKKYGTFIPIQDVEAYEKRQERPVYSKDMAIQEFSKDINAYPCRHLRETVRLYLDFGRRKIIACKSSNPERIKDLAENSLTKTFSVLILQSQTEIYELSNEELQTILYTGNAPMRSNQFFVQFLRYCYAIKDIKPEKDLYFVQNKPKSDDGKEIYSPEIYHDFYLHVQDIQNHLPRAIKSAYYANMWLYTIMHLSDVWRASDIVNHLPSLELDDLGIGDFAWFEKNRLTIRQCQILVHQVYLKTKSKVTGKTGALLSFFVPPDLLECMATSMVLSELHRRLSKNKNNSHILLSTFKEGRTISTVPKKFHLRFFEERPHLKVFRSLVMNRSTMTYLFYGITEENNKDSDLALELIQHVRSHTDQNTSAIYVKATNKDGSINRVSYNLCRRGHFGWLYNYMIMAAAQSADVRQTLEDRTQSIELLRKDLSLQQTERWAEFFNTVRHRRKTIMQMLYRLSREDLIKIIIQVYSGKMPSKSEYGQCLAHPKCSYPRRSSCFGCEWFIPQYFILTEANNEIQRLIKSIKECQYGALIDRDTGYILHLLDIIEQAIEYFGEEYVLQFVNLPTLETKLEEIAHLIALEQI
ncbi:hypothetical protein ACTNDP_00100 [Paenibacillus barengoltzii]|uniref:hypothetical protein n=1 Tax=Paenibacillus barengoltzii TaxID=343517 RepID=UPI003F88F907